ncbi:MAG TPA: tRNA (adenosine(37)-N6)-threonylcarbamoyltransferase complex dimerization subunit type 1 TsaB [bacterium]|nr:tRNA (adenosine(37)-N6)-threonylcarbamoyltransferase complex dimerization subunit type 1 TsaB [bacterium]
MRILAIETATPVASVAVLDRSGLLAETVIRAPMHHLEWLLPAVHEMLEHLGLTSDSIEGLAVSCGPGGFTGLRIGMATAMAWAKARDLPVLGIGTLEALAHVPGVDGLVFPVLDAHRGEVAGALYRVEANGVGECLIPPLVASPEALVAGVGPYPGPVLLLGDGLDKYGTAMFSALGGRARAGGAHLHPRAAAVGMLAVPRLISGARTDLNALRPVYGRRPVAWPGKETLRRGGNQR